MSGCALFEGLAASRDAGPSQDRIGYLADTLSSYPTRARRMPATALRPWVCG
jgi:hypothetical protein